MIKNPEISRHNFIFKYGSIWDINTVSVISYDDDRTFQRNSFTKCDISRNGKMVQLQDIGDRRKSWQELLDLKMNDNQ